MDNKQQIYLELSSRYICLTLNVRSKIMPHKIGSQCIGCTACAKSCPVFAIDGEPKNQHTINEKRCVDCGVCGRLCPKSAISDSKGQTVKNLPRSEWKKPKVDISICSACQMCVQICRFNCISISKPTYTGDVAVYAILENPAKCVGCGMCERVCPLGAITMKGGEK